MPRLEYFHENRIALQLEVPKHPKLVELLQNHPVEEFEIRISEIALYCDVILHGDYLDRDIDGLCGHLTDKLRAKRLAIFIH